MDNSYRTVAGILDARESRKMANNSYLVQTEGKRDREGHPGTPGTIAYKLHDTYVVLYHANGVVELNSGGWRTVTTKDRINRCLNQYGPRDYSVYSERNVWKLWRTVGSRDVEYRGDYSYSTPIREVVAEFADGMLIHPDGSVTGAMTAREIAKRDVSNVKLAKLLKRYLAGSTSEGLARVQADHGGDCWYCQMHVASPVHKVSDGVMTTTASPEANGPPLGDVMDSDHLWSHLGERYYMRSLCLNALAFVGYRDPLFLWEMAISREDPSMVKRALSRYFTAKLRAS